MSGIDDKANTDALKMFGTSSPQTTTNTPEGPSSNVSASDLLAHLTTIKNNLRSFIGKPGYNAHLWASNNIKPLEDRIKKHVDNGDDITPELVAMVKALPTNPQPLAPGVERNAKNPPSQPQSAGGDIPVIRASTIKSNEI